MSPFLLPLPLALLAAACGVEIVRDLKFRRYAEAFGGLIWGMIFLAATMMSAGPLIALLHSRA